MRRYQQEQLGDVGSERLPIVEHCHAELQLNILRSLYAFDQIQQHFVRQFVQAVKGKENWEKKAAIRIKCSMLACRGPLWRVRVWYGTVHTWNSVRPPVERWPEHRRGSASYQSRLTRTRWVPVNWTVLVLLEAPACSTSGLWSCTSTRSVSSDTRRRPAGRIGPSGDSDWLGRKFRQIQQY